MGRLTSCPYSREVPMRMFRFVMAGLLVAGLVVMADAQQGRGFGGFGFGPNILILNESVQKDLKLSDEQVEKVKTWSEEQRAKAGDNKGKFADLKDLSKEERAEKMATWAAETRKSTYKDLAGVLKPEQIARLKQIELQASGIRAFQSEETVSSLKLTDSQKSKIKSVVEEYNKDSAELGFGGGFGKGKGGGGFDKEKMAENQKKREKLEKSAFADITDVLTDDQKKTWKELTGETFDRTKLFGGFGGGFGGNKGKAKAKD